MLAEAASFACQLGELPAALRFAEEAEKAALAARETSDREAAESGELSRWVTIHRTEVLLAAGELIAARDLMSPLGGMRNGGEIWDATVAALNVFIGLRAGDRALIGAYFDRGLLRRAVDRRQVDLCGLLLMGFPEVMAARGLTEDLTKALRTCAEQRFVDARCTIPLAIARYGPMDCVDLAGIGTLPPGAPARRSGRRGRREISSMPSFQNVATTRARRSRPRREPRVRTDGLAGVCTKRSRSNSRVKRYPARDAYDRARRVAGRHTPRSRTEPQEIASVLRGGADTARTAGRRPHVRRPHQRGNRRNPRRERSHGPPPRRSGIQ